MVGRGTHRVRRSLKRIRTPQVVRGLVDSMGRRWWPNSQSADGATPAGKRWKLPASLQRFSQSANTAGKKVGPPKSEDHRARRLAWDFAVVTAAAAILLVFHHQFKKPFRSFSPTTPLAAVVEPTGDRAADKPATKRRSRIRHQAIATNDPPANTAGESRLASLQADNAAPLPKVDEPALPKSDREQFDTKRSEDSPAPTASRSASPIDVPPPQAALVDTKSDQPQPDPKALPVGDNSFPALNDPPAAKSDSPAPGPSLGSLDDRPAPQSAAAPTSPASTPVPAEIKKSDDSRSMVSSDSPPLKDTVGEPKVDHLADKPAAAAAGDDAFGALKDPPTEKHDVDVKGPEPSLNGMGDNPVDQTPPKRRRRRRPPQPENATPAPSLAADQTPKNDLLPETKPTESLKKDEIAKPTETPQPSLVETKKTDDGPVPALAGDATPPKEALHDPKIDHPTEKPTVSAAGKDAFGELKDPPAEKHELLDEHESKGPEPAVTAAGDKPPEAVPHRRRRRAKPPQPETTPPGPVLAVDQGTKSDPAPAAKTEETVKAENPAKSTETPKPAPLEMKTVPLEISKSEPKLNEPKLAEPPVSKSPPAEMNVAPAKAEPQPPISPATPTPVATASIATPNLAPHPAVVEEDAPANVSFARRTAEKNGAGNSLTYKIVVRNNGSKPVKLVEVDEAVPPDHAVQATDPSADPHDQTLHWNLRDLAPHEERTIAITLVPPAAPQSVVRTAELPKNDRLDENHEPTAKTDESDKLPHVELELIVPAKLRTGETCRIGFRTTNLGPKTSGLKLNLDLPAELHFQRGQQLEYKVGGLDENESREDYLSAVATGAGTVEIRGEIVLDGHRVVAAKATCRIAGVLATQQTRRPKRDGAVVPAGATDNTTPSGSSAAAPCNCGP
jgi:hypothetical protein